MEFRLSRYAEEEMTRRGIPRAWVDTVLKTPHQRVPQPGAKEILQSRVEAGDGRIYLVRAVVATDREPPVVITVYRTSKIAKYWRPE